MMPDQLIELDSSGSQSAAEQLVSEPWLASWRYGRIGPGSPLNRVDAWLDAEGMHPLRRVDAQGVGQKTFKELMRALRNGMAHGNVVYLSERFGEDAQRPVRHLAFVSNADQGSQSLKQVVCVEVEAFEDFLRAWTAWLSGFTLPSKISLARRP